MTATAVSYSTTDVVNALTPSGRWNCTMALHRWRAEGAIVPSHNDPQGPGTKALWSIHDLDRLQAIWRVRTALHDIGLPISAVIVRSIWDSLTAGRTWSLHLEASVPS